MTQHTRDNHGKNPAQSGSDLYAGPGSESPRSAALASYHVPRSRPVGYQLAARA